MTLSTINGKGGSAIIKKIVLNSAEFLIILCFAGTALPGEQSISYRNAKAVGIGDTKVAGGFDYNGFIDNPALLSRVGIIRANIANFPVIVNDNIVEISKFIQDNRDNYENFSDLSDQKQNDFRENVEKYSEKWGRLNISPMADFALSLIGHSVGLAIFNTTDLKLKMDSGLPEPSVQGEGFSNTAVVLGYARPLYNIYPGLTAGMNIKFLHRKTAALFKINPGDLGSIRETLEPVRDEFKNVHNSLAVDIGTLWDIPLIDSEVGATIQSIGDGSGSSLDIGIAKYMYVDRLIILADYRDIFDTDTTNTLDNVHLGAVYTFPFFTLRAGINYGYPTFGFGLKYKIFDVDCAFFRDEYHTAMGTGEDNCFIGQLKLGW